MIRKILLIASVFCSTMVANTALAEMETLSCKWTEVREAQNVRPDVLAKPFILSLDLDRGVADFGDGNVWATGDRHGDFIGYFQVTPRSIIFGQRASAFTHLTWRGGLRRL